MNITITKNGKTATLPVEINSKHMADALTFATPFLLDDSADHTKLYTVQSAFDKLHNEFHTLPIMNLLIKAGLFTKNYMPQPWMFENELAGELSNLIKYSHFERKKPFYFITSKGMDFLEHVLFGLRRDIDAKIFKR